MEETAKPNQTSPFESTPPPILSWEGQKNWQKPRFEARYFHRKRIEVWNGYVRTRDVKGWVDNVRIELFVEKWKRDNHGLPPGNEDILQWMKNDPYDEFDLKSLGESIVNNGVRQPIVVTSDGVLLDGNRRYFAALMMLEKSEQEHAPDISEMVSQLPAYVLSPTCEPSEYDSVLVEENFVDDCRREWPNFIKAKKVFEAYGEMRERGKSRSEALSDLVVRFGILRSRAERFIKMMDLIQEFHDHHSTNDEESGQQAKDEYEVRWRAQKYFEYFDELHKTRVLNTLDNDPELRTKVFERLYDGDFSSFAQIRKVPEIAADRRARDKFILGSGKRAVDEAIEWVTVVGVAKKALNNNDRITSFLRFLLSLTAEEMENLDPVAITELKNISTKVADMANAAKGGEKDN